MSATGRVLIKVRPNATEDWILVSCGKATYDPTKDEIILTRFPSVKAKGQILRATSDKDGAEPPVARHGEQPVAESFVNPLPHTLMLTAIVVSVGTTGVALALLIRIHRRFNTLNDEELIRQLKR